MKAKSTNRPQLSYLSILFWSVMLLILTTGVYWRVAKLNDTSSHSDAIIHDACKIDVTPGDILKKWERIVGNTGQLATPAAFTKLFLNIFRLPATRGNIILPSALWGILTIIIALWAGWRLGGRWFGILLMSVVAFNPTHIQMSRIAYFYQPCIAGSFLMLGCLVVALGKMQRSELLGWRFHVLHGIAVLLLLYSSANAWPMTCCCAAFLCVTSLIKARRLKGAVLESIVLACTYVVIGLPLLFVSWGVPALLATTADDANRAYGRRIFALLRERPVGPVIVHEFAKLGWGWTTMRMAAGCVLFAIGSAVLAWRIRREKAWAIVLVAFFGVLGLSVMALESSSWYFGLRRVSSLWPYAFVIYAAGLAWPWMLRLPEAYRAYVKAGWGVIVVALFGLWIITDYQILQTKGFPIPYRQISQWMDATFPRGTPVVTDRFFTAMCEFNNSDPTTNVVVLSTVPNELPEIQEKTRFRDLTRQYFEENPDAMFYCAGHMYERPEVVPWEWPTRYFRQSRLFKDEYADRLNLIGQGYVEYPGRQRWPMLYYNTLEDIVAIKQAVGAKGFVMWGPDWRPIQTQDYRLWRLLLAGDASLQVYNLGENEQELTLDVTGVAAGGELRLQLGEQVLGFPANQMSQHRYRMKLQPGMNVVPVRSRGAPNARLLAGKVVVESGER